MSEIPAFTPLGRTPPNRSMLEDEFVPAADAFAAWMPLVVDEMGLALTWTAEQLTLIVEVKTQAVEEINTLASQVNSAVEEAAESASAAAQAKQAAEAFANFKGPWADLSGPLAMPATVLDNGKFWVLLTDLSDVTLSQPGVSADWEAVSKLQGEATGAIDMNGFDLNANHVSADRIDYASVATQTVLDFAVSNSFRIDATGTDPITLTFANLAALGRTEIGKINIIGNTAAVIWPAEIDWDEGDEAPELGEQRSRVLIDHDNGVVYGCLSASK